MVTDQEPRYRFRDSNGNITGTVFERGGELVVQEGTSGTENELVLQSDGTLKLQEATSGDDNELVLQSDGTVQAKRYRFRDSDGNITGTVFERGGELVVQEATSGDDNELVLQSDGTVQAKRYRFRDSDGDITGTVFERGGELVVQEATSGDDNELVLQSDGTVRAKRLAGGYLYAGAFDGSDADARLDNALAAVNESERIKLEDANYTADRTFTTALSLSGIDAEFASDKGTVIRGDFTFEITGKLDNLRLESSVLTSNDRVSLNQALVKDSTIQLNGNQCKVTDSILVGSSDITFASGTSKGVVDTIAGTPTVTDNGSNTVGDIA